MKRLFSIMLMFVWAASIMVAADCNQGDILPKHVRMEKQGALMVVNMNLDLQSLDVPGNKTVIITPVIRNGTVYQELTSVGVYGKRRYIQYQRVYGGMITGEKEHSFKASKAPASYVYREVVPFKDWMKGALLELHVEEYGCCRSVLYANTSEPLASFSQVSDVPVQPAFIIPKAESIKHRQLAGRAYIDFPVNQTGIYPNYRRNPTELAIIKATIDSIKGDEDMTVKSLSLKGFASPESSWTNNTRLAKGRTQALKEYVMGVYHFNSSQISTSYEPEDWAGLKAYMKSSNMVHRDAILTIINSGMEPDAREWKLKSTYPKEYRFLLENVYPGLRHCDYVIEYDIRSYSHVSEIAQVFKTHPQKLSLKELYLLATSYPEDSQEYADVFETAAKMYPTDATANLNAGNCVLARGELGAAKRYLAKAGNTPQAAYARGILAAKNGDKETAISEMKTAYAGGVTQAQVAIEYLSKFK